MIKELKELIDFISRSPSIKLKTSVHQLSVRCQELFEVIHDNNQVTDELASQLIYNRKPHGAYYNLRSRLYQELVDRISLQSNTIETRSMQYDEVRDRCITLTATVRVLSTKGLMKNVVFLCEKLIKTTTVFDLNDISVELLKMIIAYYGLANRNKKKFLKYSTMYHQIEKIRSIEDELQVKYYSIFSDVDKIENNFNDETAKHQFEVERLNNLLIENLSFKTNFFCYNILCLYYTLKPDYQELLRVTNDGYRYTRSSVQASNRLAIFFLQRRLTAEIRLNQRQEMLQTLNEIEKWAIESTNTYFIVGVYKCLLALHNKSYEDAYDHVNVLMQSKYYKDLPKTISEYIDLMYGYLVLLANGDFFNTESKPKFRIYKLLNNIPGYQKDKRGANVSVLILHVLFLILNRKPDEVIDRVDALRLYTYRYLRKDSTFRSNCFIKMLIQMAKADFHPIRTERYTAKLYSKLKSHPLQLSEQPLEVEIIPYEDLWEITLQLLERNSKIRRGRPKKIK